MAENPFKKDPEHPVTSNEIDKLMKDLLKEQREQKVRAAKAKRRKAARKKR